MNETHLFSIPLEKVKTSLVCDVQAVFPRLDQCSEEEKVQRLLELKLRYFTPREVANLMGFPQSFCKPNLQLLKDWRRCDRELLFMHVLIKQQIQGE